MKEPCGFEPKGTGGKNIAAVINIGAKNTTNPPIV